MPSYSSRTHRGGRAHYRSFGGNTRRTTKRKSSAQYINPTKFIKKATILEETPYEAQHTFQDFAINELIKENISKKGYLMPSPIQDQAIPLALLGHDIIGLANTGTGKTAAFGIPVLNTLMTNPDSRALIIAPTRELAQQIEEELQAIGKGSGLYGALLIGGERIGPQIRDLSVNPQIIIGTPGRIKDHVERGTLSLGGFNLAILDEVDRMLDMGFIGDIREILGMLHTKRQSLFFSATLDNKIGQLIEQFSNDPVKISVKSGDSSQNVHQDVVRYQALTDKIEKLHDVLNDDLVEKIIIFDETQRAVERLSNELITRGFSADAIHGGKTQGQRKRALDKFKSNKVNILVATDVAARGIDVSDITHVINYSVPQTYDDYIHRVGRAGRAGRVGYALTFVK